MIFDPARMPEPAYCGRFAPSPTGPLHAGSLVAALASFLDARAHSGAWRLRIDDIDPPRAVAGSVDSILEMLGQHGLRWDGDVDFQSRHSARYDAAIARLASLGHVFCCRCTRTSLDARGCCVEGCRDRHHTKGSLRVAVPAERTVSFTDIVAGEQSIPLGSQLSDFIIRRRDGLYAYQLAAAVDDADGAITHVIRGADLQSSTPRQLLLQTWLDLKPPQYGHVPVLTDAAGNKLSKQTGAQPLDPRSAAANLRAALDHLGQPPPPAGLSTPESLLDWAQAHWDRGAVPR